MVGRVLPEARILAHVVEADHSFAPKGRAKDFGRARHREFFEGGARHAGESVEHVGGAPFVQRVVEEGAELRPGHARAGVGDGLHHPGQVQLGRNGSRDLVEALGHRVFLLQRQLFLPALGHVVENHHRTDHLARGILDRRGAVFDRNLPAVAPHQNGVILQALHRTISERAGDRIHRR